MSLAQYTGQGNGIFGSGIELGGLFDGLKINAEDYSDVIEKIRDVSLDDVLDGDKLSVEKLSKAIGTSDGIILKYAETLKDTNGNIALNTASTESLSQYLKKTGNSFDFAAIKATLFNTVLNAGIGFIASVGLQFVIGLIDEYVHSVDIAKESAESFNEEIKQLQTTQSNNTKTISDLESEYKKLSSGVNNLGDNISLTTDEYDRYHDITNQIADIMPNLIQGFDKQNNAILKVKGDLVDLNEEYKKYQQNEAIELYNARDDEGNLKRESIFENAENQYKQTSVFDSLSSVERLEYLHSLYQLNLEDAKELSKSIDSNDFYLQKLLGEHGFNYLEGFNGIDVTTEEFTKVRESIKAEIDALEADIDSSLLQLGQQGILYAQGLEEFYSLGEYQTHLSSILNNLSPDFVADNKLYDEKNFEKFVRDLTSKLTNADVQEALTNLYDVDMKTLALEEVNDYIDTIAKLLGVNIDTLQEAFGLNYNDQIQNVKAMLSKEDWSKINQLSLEQLSFAEELKVDESVLLSWNELLERIQKIKDKKIDTPFQEVASSVQSLTSGFDQLDSIYADLLNGENFDYGNFLSNETFAATFGNLTDVTDEYKNAYSDFVETIANSNGKMTSETQDAFNKLATAYIEHGTALDTVTEATRESTVAQLEQMGVANAKQVVDERIIANTQAQAIQEQYLTQTGQVLLNQSWEQISAYLNEANAGDVAAQVMARLKLQQLDLTNNPINCAESIYQLYALAQAAGLTGQAMENISNMNRMQKTLDTMKENGYEGTPAYLALQNRLDNLAAATSSTADTWTDFSNTVYDFEPVQYAGGVNSLAAAQNNLAGATNDATDATQAQIDALEKEKEALEETKAEMEELHDAIVWFYDKLIDKIDEKIDAINEENEALEKQKEHMDTIIAAIESNYDTEIQAIQDKIDALKTSNDEEERALALEEAKRKLQEAKSRKTLQVYQTGAGFTYQVDTTAIKEAENELAELQENEVTEELEKQIDKLEEAKQKWSEIPEAYEKAMQEIAASSYFGANWTTTTLFPSDKLFHSFQNNYTGIQSDIAANEGRIESYEVEKEAVENLKQLWDDAKNAYTYAEYEKKLQTFIGSDYEYELLNNSAVWREEYATKYAEICAQIESLEEQIKLASESTSTAVSNIGTAAQTSADQVNALNASLDAINGKKTESTHTHTNITRNITYSESSPYGWGNPYQSVTDHAKNNGFATYAKGGIITRKAAGNLDYVAKSLGEDHMIAVQEGEAVIPKESVKANESLVRDLINGNAVIDEDKFQENYAKLMGAFELNVLKFQTPDYEHLVSRQAGSKVVQFNGDIHVHEAQDADGLSKAIVTKLPMAMLQELNRRDF